MKARRRETIHTIADAQRALDMVERRREKDRKYNKTQARKDAVKRWQKRNRKRLNKARRDRYARLKKRAKELAEYCRYMPETKPTRRPANGSSNSQGS